jgi:hypothetical protein
MPLAYASVALGRRPLAPARGVGYALRSKDDVESESSEWKLLVEKSGMWNDGRCFKMHPARGVWIVNFVALLGHVAIASVVLYEGLPHGEKLEFRTVSLVGRWHNATVDGYTYMVEDSFLGRISLTWTCALFSLLSAAAHLFVLVASSGVYGPLAYWYYECLYECRVPWRCVSSWAAESPSPASRRHQTCRNGACP